MELRPDTARRLAFIRLLLSKATEESRLAPPYCYDSLSRLHDAAEMFLALAVQERHLAMPRDFMKYWDVLDGSLGRPLMYRAQAERFNKARVGWKHYGTEPSQAEIDAARVTVTGLLTDECPEIFGAELGDVSLTAFISSEQVRELMESAQRRWEAGDDETEGFGDLADAFHYLIRDYEQRKTTGRNSVFDSAADLTFISSFRLGQQGREKEFTDKVISSIQALDFSVMLVGLGVDFRRYGKFKALCPDVRRSGFGGRVVVERQRNVPRSQADYEFCRDFVINSAIHLAAFDYDVNDDLYVKNQIIVRRQPRRATPPSDESAAT